MNLYKMIELLIKLHNTCNEVVHNRLLANRSAADAASSTTTSAARTRAQQSDRLRSTAAAWY